jgi:hypothetical protein
MAAIHNFIATSGGLRRINLVISANTQNYNIKTAALGAGWNGTSPVAITVTINYGVYVGSTSNASPGIDTGTGYPSNVIPKIINNGYILGTGGNANGGAGGPALRAQAPIKIDNNGVIGGGGGGGGYGAQRYGSEPNGKAQGPTYYGGGGGGGGGAGYTAGSGGGTNGSSTGTGSTQPSGGASGSFLSPGGGGGGGAGYTQYVSGGEVYGGGGGSGGGLGANGSTGGNGYNGSRQNVGGISSSASGGGAAGACTVAGSNANITWINTGTRYGALG